MISPVIKKNIVAVYYLNIILIFFLPFFLIQMISAERQMMKSGLST